MAHWHSYNPWADRLVYLPDLKELALVLFDPRVSMRTPAERVAHWETFGGKIDAYLIKQPDGWIEVGLRFGQELHEYSSPNCASKTQQEGLKELWELHKGEGQ